MTSVDGDPSVFLSIHGSNVQVIGTQYFMANAIRGKYTGMES